MNATNFFQLVGAESETVFVLLGLNPDLKTIEQARDQGAESWMYKNYEKYPIFNIPEIVFQTVKSNLDKVIAIS